MPTETPISLLVATERVALKITQAELAIRIGVDGSYINMIENGRKTPASVQFLERLASGLTLSEIKKQELFEAARLSQRTVRLPSHLPVTGYSLAAKFIAGLGELNEDQIGLLNRMIDAFPKEKIDASYQARA